MRNCTTSFGMMRRDGFTLLEMLVAMVIVSVIAAVLMPIILTATDGYTVSRDTRASTDRVLYALERSARFIREVPFADDDSGLAIASAGSSSLVLSDGRGLRLSAGNLEILDAGGSSAVLCSDVDRLTISYFDESGNPIVLMNPQLIHRIGLQIQSGDIVLETYSMPRAWIGRAES